MEIKSEKDYLKFMKKDTKIEDIKKKNYNYPFNLILNVDNLKKAITFKNNKISYEDITPNNGNYQQFSIVSNNEMCGI